MTTPATTSTVVVEPGAQELSFPAVLDSSHASNAAADFFRSYFTAKSKQGVAGTMQHFLPEQNGPRRCDIGLGVRLLLRRPEHVLGCDAELGRRPLIRHPGSW